MVPKSPSFLRMSHFKSACFGRDTTGLFAYRAMRKVSDVIETLLPPPLFPPLWYQLRHSKGGGVPASQAASTTNQAGGLGRSSDTWRCCSRRAIGGLVGDRLRKLGA